MIQLLVLLAVSMCLAYCSQKGILVIGITQKRKLDIPFVIMITILALFVGLRTNFNDTYTYISTFKTYPTVSQVINSDHELMDNPLFYLFQAFFKHHIIDDANAFFLVIAFFSLGSILHFIKKHSDNFPFSVLIFFALGLYVSHLAAMKQCLAIGILTFAIDALINKKYIRYFIIVFIAMLFHAYAIFFAVLPFFTHKPWSIATYFTIAALLLVMFSFESVITNFLSIADDAGKSIDSKYIFDTESINLFRLAVFAVPPLLSFVFQELLDKVYDRSKMIIMNMSIISFFIMCLGLSGGANLFGRSAIYFELGAIIMTPTIIQNIFDDNSKKLGIIITSGCYLLFFAYSIQGFSTEYRAISVIELLTNLL